MVENETFFAYKNNKKDFFVLRKLFIDKAPLRLLTNGNCLDSQFFKIKDYLFSRPHKDQFSKYVSFKFFYHTFVVPFRLYKVYKTLTTVIKETGKWQFLNISSLTYLLKSLTDAVLFRLMYVFVRARLFHFKRMHRYAKKGIFLSKNPKYLNTSNVNNFILFSSLLKDSLLQQTEIY